MAPRTETLRSLQRVLHRAELVWCVIGLMTCTFLIFIQVTNRWLVRAALMGVMDLALYIFIAFMLIAATYTTWNEGHIAVDLFRDKYLGGRRRALAVHKASMVVIAIAVALALFPATLDYMIAGIKYPQFGTLVRWFNISWLQIVMFVMLILVLLHLFVIARRDVNNVVRAYRAESEEHR